MGRGGALADRRRRRSYGGERMHDGCRATADDRRLSLSAGDRETAQGFPCFSHNQVSENAFARAAWGSPAAKFAEIAGTVAAIDEWTMWVAAYRYPSAEGSPEPEPDDEELRRALATIDE